MSQENIKLNFINRSYDSNNSRVVIFQKNGSDDSDILAIAWQVIQNCGRNSNHPFTYPFQFEVCATDGNGNDTSKFTAQYGQAYEMVKSTSGNVFQLSDTPAVSTQEVEIRNNLEIGSINANIYRAGKLIAAQTGVVPDQKAIFQFHPIIFIGVASQVVEGEVINSAIVQQINTEINLIGIRSADIVMTGGGSGKDATAFEFNLENIDR